MPPTSDHPPRILIASLHTAAALELQQLAERRGFAVRRVYSGLQALEQSFAFAPDVIVLDEALPEMDSLDASRTLRDDNRIGGGIPILLLTARRPSPPEHHVALRAGIWEYVTHPFQQEELAAKLASYVLLRREASRSRNGHTLADASGLYTVHGLALRAQELTLQAFHHAAPLACIALAPVTSDSGKAVELVAKILRDTARRSDAIGRVGPAEFAVVAPGTDGVGAVLLAERVARAVHAARVTDGAGLRAGYDAVANARYTPIEPKNLLGRATSALRAAKAGPATGWIRAFQ